MSDFFDWIGEITPTLLWLVIWACVAPIRLTFMLCLPRNADKRYHWAYPVYEFFAFERG